MRRVRKATKVNEDPTLRRITDLVRKEGRQTSSLMFRCPTQLEMKLKGILDSNKIKYSFQKLFFRFRKGSRDYVDAYYVANFWISGKRLMLDVDSSARNVVIGKQDYRIFSNEDITPHAQVLRIEEEDLNYPMFVDELMAVLK